MLILGKTEIPKINTQLQLGDRHKPITTGFNHFNGLLVKKNDAGFDLLNFMCNRLRISC
jgi:hypothetical protein